MYTGPEEKLGCGVEGEARDQFLWQLKTGCGFVGSVEGAHLEVKWSICLRPFPDL